MSRDMERDALTYEYADAISEFGEDVYLDLLKNAWRTLIGNVAQETVTRARARGYSDELIRSTSQQVIETLLTGSNAWGHVPREKTEEFAKEATDAAMGVSA